MKAPEDPEGIALRRGMALEKYLFRPASWEALYRAMPRRCQSIVRTPPLEPHGIGWCEKNGWFILCTAGQGPMLVWSQK